MEVFIALTTPFAKLVIPGINLKNLKNLKTRDILKTKRKLKSTYSSFTKSNNIEGKDIKTRIKSILFQFELMYGFHL